jgi:DNA-binding beta-propeller fold protein YncE
MIVGVPLAETPGCEDAFATPAPAAVVAEPLPCAQIPLVDDKCEAWQAPLYDGPGGGLDSPGIGEDMTEIIDSGPDGSTVYTLGTTDAQAGPGLDAGLVTIATDASNGSTRWTSRFPGDPETPGIWAMAVLADPDGDLVYSVGRGYVDGLPCPSSTSVVAYDAATGAEAWSITRSLAPACSYAWAATVDPAGERLLVVGKDDGTDGKSRFSVVALAANTGAELWTDSYHGGFQRGASASAVTTSPDGSRVYVAGSGLEDRQGLDAGIAWPVRAYDAATGALVWEHRWMAPRPQSGFPANPPAALVTSPDGNRLFMTGGAEGATLFDIFTVALDSSDGHQLWQASHEGLRAQIKSSFDSVWYHGPLAVSPDGSGVFVSGYQTCLHGVNICMDFITLGYDAATGAVRFEVRHTSEQWLHWFPEVHAAPNGSRIYVSGQVRHFKAEGLPRYTTLAYDPADGSQEWIARHSNGHSYWSGMTMSPDGARIFVTGSTAQLGEDPGTADPFDIDTVAYDT